MHYLGEIFFLIRWPPEIENSQWLHFILILQQPINFAHAYFWKMFTSPPPPRGIPYGHRIWSLPLYIPIPLAIQYLHLNTWNTLLTTKQVLKCIRLERYFMKKFWIAIITNYFSRGLISSISSFRYTKTTTVSCWRFIAGKYCFLWVFHSVFNLCWFHAYQN